MLFLSNLNKSLLNLSSQANTRSIVLNLSLKIFLSNLGFLPFDDLLFLLFLLILGIILLLKINFLFESESYTPSKLNTLPFKSKPTSFAVSSKGFIASFNSGHSFLLPGAAINGDIMLQFLSHIATILSPF